MNQPSERTLTLFDLIARCWQAGGAVSELRFTGDGTALAITTAAGAVAIAAVADAEPPAARIRITGDLGQATIRPRTGGPAPLTLVGGLADGPPPLAAAQDHVLVGEAGGAVRRLFADGTTEATPLRTAGAVTAIAHASATGAIAAADPDGLYLSGAEPAAETGIAGLAFSADGSRLAAAAGTRLLLTGPNLPVRTIALPATGPLRWRHDAACLAAALGVGGLGVVAADTGSATVIDGFPAPVRSLAWSEPAGALVAAGAFRIAAWEGAPLPGAEVPLATGRAGLVAVAAVATHPTRCLVAAGYANGQVVIAELGGRDELLLRQGGGPVTALAFSPDGSHLAIGDSAGTAAIATFPPQMFK